MTRFAPHGPDETRAAAERAVDDELAFHRERTVEELKGRGLTEAEAEREAGRRFGSSRHRSALVHMERRRQAGARRRTSMEVFRTSVRAVVRGIRRSPRRCRGDTGVIGKVLPIESHRYTVVGRRGLSSAD